MALEVILYSINYNAIELAFVVGFSVGLYLGEIWPWLLWLGFVATVVWVLISSLKESEAELYKGLKAGEIYVTDFISGAVVYLVLMVLVIHEAFQFWVMYLVAAVQYMRYTVLAYKRLQEERRRESG